MTREAQIRAIIDTAAAVDGKVRIDYSGRGMFGKKCLGVVAKYREEIIEAAAERGLKGSCSDNMGLSVIVYWPRIAGLTDDEMAAYGF